MIALLLTSSSLARSLMRILSIPSCAAFFASLLSANSSSCSTCIVYRFQFGLACGKTCGASVSFTLVTLPAFLRVQPSQPRSRLTLPREYGPRPHLPPEHFARRQWHQLLKPGP